MEQDEDWPIELKHRIPHDELVVITENVKITKQNQLVTTSKGEEDDEITTHTETRAEEFKQSFTGLYKDLEARQVQRISDHIRRALIKDYIDIAEYFEGPLTDEERKLVGRWKFTTNDPSVGLVEVRLASYNVPEPCRVHRSTHFPPRPGSGNTHGLRNATSASALLELAANAIST